MTHNQIRRPMSAMDGQAGAQRNRNRWLAFLGATALLLVVGLACGGSTLGTPGGSGASATGAGSSASQAPASSSADLAPDFAFTLFQGEQELGGTELNVSDLEGRPVVLNFWAGLCPPCRAEMPDLQAFYNGSKDEVTLVGIDVGQFLGLGSLTDAEDLLRELNITYPAGFTNDSNVVRDYRVLGMPTTVFINPDGTIFDRWTGALNREILDEKIESMLLEQQG